MSPRRTVRAVVAGVLACSLTALVAVSIGDSTSAASSGSSIGDGPTKISELPVMAAPIQVALYPALGRPITAEDESLRPSAEIMEASGAEEPEPIVMEADQVRKVDTGAGVDVGIMPSEKGMCVVVSVAPDEVTGSCIPEASIESAGLNVGFERADRYFAVGVLPSSWSKQVMVVGSDGQREEVLANGDGAYIVAAGQAPREIIVTDGLGVRHPVLGGEPAASGTP